jgi:hypothetical protein
MNPDLRGARGRQHEQAHAVTAEFQYQFAARACRAARGESLTGCGIQNTELVIFAGYGKLLAGLIHRCRVSVNRQEGPPFDVSEGGLI